MKKFEINKKVIIFAIIATIAIVGLVIFTINILNDENKLSVEEKEWITENINIVQNINVPNNLPADELQPRTTQVNFRPLFSAVEDKQYPASSVKPVFPVWQYG